MEAFDYIIIGAGSAGCALVAELLRQKPKTRVLILEAGRSDRRFWVQTPIGYGVLFFDKAANWCYQAEADGGMAGRTGYWPRGKIVGGSSSINAMVWCRGLPQDHQDWLAAGNQGWGWDEAKRLYQKLESWVDADNNPLPHAKGQGQQFVSDMATEYHRLKDYYFAATEELGEKRVYWPQEQLSADDKGDGVVTYPINCHKGRRWSAADAWLYPTLKHNQQQIELRLEAYVQKIGIEKGRASTVTYRHHGQEMIVKAHAEIILAAGAIGSPLLLQASGIGDASFLQAKGIDSIVNNQHVGQGLQDHMAVSYFYKSRIPTLNQQLGTKLGQFFAGVNYVVRRRGPLALSVNQLGGFVRSHDGLSAPDLQLYCNPMSYSKDDTGKRDLFRPDRHSGFILSFNPTRPTSRGSVSLTHANQPWHQPKIEPHVLSTPEDCQTVIQGARYIRRLEACASLQQVIEAPVGFALAGASDEELLADFRQRSGTVFHASGSCRMAPRDQGGVVDAQLKVYGVEGLRVADASIFPNVTSGNTNAPSQLVGLRAGEIITANSIP